MFNKISFRITVLMVVLLAALFVSSCTMENEKKDRDGITSFSECVEEDNEVLEPDCMGCPRQCITEEGAIFDEFPTER